MIWVVHCECGKPEMMEEDRVKSRVMLCFCVCNNILIFVQSVWSSCYCNWLYCVALCVCCAVCVLWREGGGGSHRTWLTVSGQMTMPFVVIFGMHQLPSSLLTGMTSM